MERPTWLGEISGRSRWQYRQTFASAFTISAQNGHFLPPSASASASSVFASAFVSNECGNAAINRTAPYIHQSMKFFPLVFAMNAGINPIRTAPTKTDPMLGEKIIFISPMVKCEKIMVTDANMSTFEKPPARHLPAFQKQPARLQGRDLKSTPCLRFKRDQDRPPHSVRRLALRT